jgi:hypothetical protein
MKDLESLVRGVKKNAILVGDFNLPEIDWEMGTGSARTAPFLEAVDDVMLTQMVDFSTQVKGNCLDLVLTNIPERIVDIEEAGRLGKSDHDMILLTVGGCGRRCEIEQRSLQLGTGGLDRHEKRSSRNRLVRDPPWKVS